MNTADNLLLQSHAAFRYTVTVGTDQQAAFTECTLPTVEWEVEEVKEGGHNEFVHQLPGRRKSSRLTLKNGVGKSSLLKWYTDSMNESFERRNITVALLDIQMETVASWHITGAYPIKWTGPQLKADANSIAIQTLEFACGSVTFESGSSAPSARN